MKKKLVLLFILSLLVVSFAGAGFIQGGTLEPLLTVPHAGTGEMVDESTNMWFVEFVSTPLADGGRIAAVRNDKAAFRSEAQKANLKYEERFAFDTLWNGISINLEPGELDKLAGLPGVKAIYPVEIVSLPPATMENSPEMAFALAMTGADVAQSELGFTGEGIKVGVMDTGIAYDHPDLGGGFGPGYRVFTGWDFVGDDFNANPNDPGYNPIPDPNDDPYDAHGHGTHVAGIIGAKGEMTGVAPDVTFGAYKVFGREGSTTADIMLAALERCLEDGMDVVNMSIGAAFQWPQYPTSQASDRLVRRNIVVVASIGNSGAAGIYSAGAPGVGKDVIGVASFDNSHTALSMFIVSPGDVPMGFVTAAAAPEPPAEGTYPMARTGTKESEADAADPLPEGSLEGKVALIRRGAVSFHVKALNAQNAGAIGVVLYNNVPGMFSPTVAGEPEITIPVVAISDADGEFIDDLIAAAEDNGEEVEITWTDQTVVSPNPTGGLISSFSSYGPAPDLSFKPDLGAPGGMIYSTYLNQGYTAMSGTSMSAPHVAGGAALLLEAQPKVRAHEVKGILQGSAEPKVWWGNPDLGFLDNVHRQGAGMMQIDKAILATTRVEPAALALGESEAGPATHRLTITNNDSSPVTYKLSHIPALSTGGSTFAPGFYAGFAEVSFSTDELTVRRNGKVDVTITANPSLPDGGVYGGYIVLTGDNGEVIRVPYMGFKGDYQAMTVLEPNPYEMPLLARLVGDTYYIQPDGAVFTLQDGDIPYILAHFHHQSRLVRADILDAETGQPWHSAFHQAFEYDYFGRNSSPDGFFAFSWNGTTARGSSHHTVEVPDGKYVIKLSVLKALGDENNPDHWETWTSPAFYIERPPVQNGAEGPGRGPRR